MDLALIDLMANKGDSVLHQSSAISKFFFVICVLIGIILADSLLDFLPLVGILLVGCLFAQISIQKMIHYALYPAFFSLLFAFIRFSVSLSAGLVVIFKAVTAAMALLLFIFTTPYPELFALINRFLPQILVDGMFFTYRIFFILIAEMRNLLTSVRLKGGYRPLGLLFNIKNLAGAIGVLFIHAFDLSEKMHQVLTIRGYNGLKTDLQTKLGNSDYLTILAGLTVIILVVII